jgi:mycofactocin precursor
MPSDGMLTAWISSHLKRGSLLSEQNISTNTMPVAEQSPTTEEAVEGEIQTSESASTSDDETEEEEEEIEEELIIEDFTIDGICGVY